MTHPPLKSFNRAQPHVQRSHLSRLSRLSWRSVVRLRAPLCLSFTALSLLLLGCEAKVGDACISSAQCGPAQLCDVTSSEGYCTLLGCEAGECPSGSTCVTFENLDTYCMATCERSSDCRDGYTCDSSLESEPFCRQAE